jgi:hypothetical protein
MSPTFHAHLSLSQRQAHASNPTEKTVQGKVKSPLVPVNHHGTRTYGRRKSNSILS